MKEATTPTIQPHRVNKPIQLLAAWLVGLILTNSSFLLAATNLDSASWLQVSLVIASIVNVPLFLFSIFLLQTKFRPEMQEDQYYSEHLRFKNQHIEIADSSNPSNLEQEHTKEKIYSAIKDLGNLGLQIFSNEHWIYLQKTI